jgi:proteasome lid subunit RPN8/RPN11
MNMNDTKSMLVFQPDVYRKMLDDAIHCFPDECCGFLFGTENENIRSFTEILVVENTKEGDKKRRFSITPRDYMKAETLASELDLTLLGVYHSHPVHPAVPSEHDLNVAMPFFSYVIVSVYGENNVSVRSWKLNDKRQFEEELIS